MGKNYLLLLFNVPWNPFESGAVSLRLLPYPRKLEGLLVAKSLS
jgi:hypothetical protein